MARTTQNIPVFEGNIPGYEGRFLFVDLTTGDVRIREFDYEYARKWIGGYGFGANILYEMMEPGVDPLGEDSVIGFVAGAMNGSPGFMGARYAVVCKSPVYGGWNDSGSGGTFGPCMRSAGFDGIFVRGISERPVYLLVYDGKAQIRDASGLWGLSTSETENAIKRELGNNRVGVSSIGPAGERQALSACIINDGSRAAGRGGSGAVIGSKKLKAVVAGGHASTSSRFKNIPVIRQINSHILDWKTKNSKSRKMNSSVVGGLSGDDDLIGQNGFLNLDSLDSINLIGVGADDSSMGGKKLACKSCPLGCDAFFDMNALDRAKHGFEYEIAGGFGGQVLNTDSDTISACSLMLNSAGIDMIAAAGTISWAMEQYGDGALTRHDLDGIDLRWDSNEAMVAMVSAICNGEGIGGVLQNGSRFASRQLGIGKDALCTIDGIEVSQRGLGYTPGGVRPYVFWPSPGRQPRNLFSHGAAAAAHRTCIDELGDCCGACEFASVALSEDQRLGMLNAITGFELSMDEYLLAGRRIFYMRQAFNIREGFERGSSEVSPRVLGVETMTAEERDEAFAQVRGLESSFDEDMGIDPENGIPLRKSLEEVGGMDNVIEDIYGVYGR